MTPLARVAGLVLALAVIFGGAVALGGVVHTNRGRALSHDGAHGAMDAMSAGGIATPPGLAVADGRFRLVADTATFARGRRAPFRFRIVDAQGATVRDFDVEHAKRMHLIVVRRDLSLYQHVHPVEAPDGSWQVPLRLDQPGDYRVFADFQSHGEKTTLGTDVFVAGDFRPLPLPAIADRSQTDGYDVELSGTARAGHEGLLSFQVSRDGEPVAVEPYLGADGHLVALRQGDLAYLHVHPQETPGSGGPIRFMIEYPSVGRYRLFLQFKHAGAVHTAAFTQAVR